jgi:hypothetical protein
LADPTDGVNVTSTNLSREGQFHLVNPSATLNGLQAIPEHRSRRQICPRCRPASLDSAFARCSRESESIGAGTENPMGRICRKHFSRWRVIAKFTARYQQRDVIRHPQPVFNRLSHYDY